MRVVVFSLMFAILLASLAFAGGGIAVTNEEVRVDYNEAYAYYYEHVSTLQVNSKDLRNFASIPLVNGSRINADIFPGSNITFTIRIENTFKEGGEDLRNVLAKVRIERIDDGSDLKEQSADFGIDPGNDNLADVKVKIPFIAESGAYKTTIEAQGIGANKTLYTASTTSILNVRQLGHDIRITNVALDPITVDCRRKATLSAEITNVGSTLENELALEFKSVSLGIDSADTDISLVSSGDNNDLPQIYSKTLFIDVPSFFKAGIYPLAVNLYWKGILFDQKTLYLTIKDCTKNTANQQQSTNNQTSVVVSSAPTQWMPKEIITRTQEVPILENPVLLSMFAGIFIITALAVIVLVGYGYVYLRKV